MSSVSFLDSILTLSKNDPGLFDSLAVSHKKDRVNLSGFYEKIDASFFPVILVNKLKKMEPFSFSGVFGDNKNQYLLYKYFLSPETKRDLSSDWVYIEYFAIN